MQKMNISQKKIIIPTNKMKILAPIKSFSLKTLEYFVLF